MHINFRNAYRRLRKSVKARRRMIRNQSTLYQIAQHATTVQASSGLACVTILKDEAPYLHEWIEFHLLMGFDHFYIYDNGSTDDTAKVLKPYQKLGLVTLTPWQNFSQVLHPQKAANAHALANFCQPYRWAAFFDVDEFMFSPKSDTLLEPLMDLGDQICVSIPWQNFGPDGHNSKPPGLVIENYTEKNIFPPTLEQRSLLRYKTILNPAEVIAAGTHCFHFKEIGPALINERGEQMRPHQFEDTQFAISEKFQLNHYFTRSEEELERKRQKGRVSSKGAKVTNFVDNRLRQYATSVCKDEQILRHIHRLKEKMK